MAMRADVEEIETTVSEKLLATVLTAFLFSGLLWVYFNIDVERLDPYESPVVLESPAPVPPPPSTLAAPDRAALARFSAAERELTVALRAEGARRQALVDRREAYRTALEEGRQDTTLAHRYRAAQTRYARAQGERRAARRALVAAEPAARAAERRLERAAEREQRRIDAQRRHDGRVSVFRRLALLLAWLGAAYALLGRLRRRRSRWLPAGVALIAAVVLLAQVMAVDYLSDYVEITDVGVLVLSLAGALMTVAAFAAAQRYLARRLPERRARRRECPFCGYPTRESSYCEGCGRDVVIACATCNATRRVGTRHCGACGAS